MVHRSEEVAGSNPCGQELVHYPQVLPVMGWVNVCLYMVLRCECDWCLFSLITTTSIVVQMSSQWSTEQSCL